MTDTAPPPPAASEATPAGPAAPAAITRGPRLGGRVLLFAATVLTVLSIFSLWANRQVLDADNWADTSAAMLNNSEIRTQMSGFLVDEVYANTDVSRQIADGLAPRLKPLAGPAAHGPRQAPQ